VNTLPPIQSFWIGRPLSQVEQLSIRSYLKNGHEFHLYCYDPLEGVPEGVKLKDAGEIVSKDRLFVREKGFWKDSYAPFAGMFRLELLLQRGGWWSDLDLVCLKALDLDRDTVIATSFERQYGDLANNNVLRFKPDDPLLKRVLEITHEKMLDPETIGPHYWQQAIKELNAESHQVPVEYFNPISWRHVKYIVEPQEAIWKRPRVARLIGRRERIGKVTKDTFCVHLWNEMWSKNGYSREATYDKGTLLEKLKSKYL
jgi:hypothetical protein